MIGQKSYTNPFQAKREIKVNVESGWETLSTLVGKTITCECWRKGEPVISRSWREIPNPIKGIRFKLKPKAKAQLNLYYNEKYGDYRVKIFISFISQFNI